MDKDYFGSNNNTSLLLLYISQQCTYNSIFVFKLLVTTLVVSFELAGFDQQLKNVISLSKEIINKYLALKFYWYTCRLSWFEFDTLSILKFNCIHVRRCKSYAALIIKFDLFSFFRKSNHIMMKVVALAVAVLGERNI